MLSSLFGRKQENKQEAKVGKKTKETEALDDSNLFENVRQVGLTNNSLDAKVVSARIKPKNHINVGLGKDDIPYQAISRYQLFNSGKAPTNIVQLPNLEYMMGNSKVMHNVNHKYTVHDPKRGHAPKDFDMWYQTDSSLRLKYDDSAFQNITEKYMGIPIGTGSKPKIESVEAQVQRVDTRTGHRREVSEKAYMANQIATEFESEGDSNAFLENYKEAKKKDATASPPAQNNNSASAERYSAKKTTSIVSPVVPVLTHASEELATENLSVNTIPPSSKPLPANKSQKRPSSARMSQKESESAKMSQKESVSATTPQKESVSATIPQKESVSTTTPQKEPTKERRSARFSQKASLADVQQSPKLSEKIQTTEIEGQTVEQSVKVKSRPSSLKGRIDFENEIERQKVIESSRESGGDETEKYDADDEEDESKGEESKEYFENVEFKLEDLSSQINSYTDKNDKLRLKNIRLLFNEFNIILPNNTNTKETLIKKLLLLKERLRKVGGYNKEQDKDENIDEENKFFKRMLKVAKRERRRAETQDASSSDSFEYSDVYNKDEGEIKGDFSQLGAKVGRKPVRKSAGDGSLGSLYPDNQNISGENRKEAKGNK